MLEFFFFFFAFVCFCFLCCSFFFWWWFVCFVMFLSMILQRIHLCWDMTDLNSLQFWMLIFYKSNATFSTTNIKLQKWQGSKNSNISSSKPRGKVIQLKLDAVWGIKTKKGEKPRIKSCKNKYAYSLQSTNNTEKGECNRIGLLKKQRFTHKKRINQSN